MSSKLIEGGAGFYPLPALVKMENAQSPSAVRAMQHRALEVYRKDSYRRRSRLNSKSAPELLRPLKNQVIRQSGVMKKKHSPRLA